MYQPAHFVEPRTEILHALIRAHPLGLLVSNGVDGPVADLVPFLLDAEDGSQGRLRVHVARANPHWRVIADAPDKPVLVVFQGVESYITPSWYETKRETGKVVPTWNYATVQVRGRARIVHDEQWLARQIRDLTDAQEAARAEPWHVDDAPQRYIEVQMRGIVGIEIDIAKIDGKWKTSQNRIEADRAGVTRGLTERGDDAALEMAELVRLAGSRP